MLRACLTTATLAVVAGTALADDAHFDVWIYADGGRLMTGAIPEGGSLADAVQNVRVFGADLGEDAPNFAAEPGFDALDGSFTPGTTISFNIRGPVREWNGSDFFTVSGSTISLDYGPASATTPLTDIVTPGFGWTVDDNGGMHEHPSYTLNDPSDGIFLLSLEFASTQAGLASSQPFWIVFNNNLDEASHDAAIGWVEENLVPAPGAAALFAIAVGFASRRRRS
jgi:hypothetical protein